MKRSEPTTQAQTKINIPKGLKTYLNDSEKYLTSFIIRILFWCKLPPLFAIFFHKLT